MEKLLFGAAYYEEYMPYDRLSKDVEMMQAAGINTVRIAESTWSTCEPQEGVFDFSHVERVLDAMEQGGISVIVGTPTYAIPTWMVKSYPDVLATTKSGRGIYGARQIMDITNPVYLFFAERVIRKLMECVAKRKCVIGYQVDNETKPYGTAGKNVQEQFVKYLRTKFSNDLEAINKEFGLDYWSNRINAWEDFPDVRGTINGSLGAEFEKFQRTLVDQFLTWQASIVSEYKTDKQFITHNFDLGWKGHSYGLQPEVNHFHAAKFLTIAGVDIYHPMQDDLTGKEIAFGGDLTRSLKKSNYLLMETAAQGFADWTPYEGQLRLGAYSHLASGANSVMYWHWHSLHNACETFWKGILSHDLQENPVYNEIKQIGNEFKKIGDHLINLKKNNKVAILVSNEALTALKWFKINDVLDYNDVVRWIYDSLYCMNVECDFICPEEEDFSAYQLITVPALYSAPEELLHRLNSYVENGGNLLVTFKSAFTDEYLKVYSDRQPHALSKCLGVTYQQFTAPKNVGLTSKELSIPGQDAKVEQFMELLTPGTAQVLASYDHPAWKKYAAITENTYGKGRAVYVGCKTSDKVMDLILQRLLKQSGIPENEETSRFPVIVRKGTNQFGKEIRYYLNYSSEENHVVFRHNAGVNLLTGQPVAKGEELILKPWNLQIVES